MSGGRDSVALAHLLHACNYRFSIAHCNFQLRAAASDEDARFSQELANTFGCPFYAERFDTQAYANENKISIQMAARALRLDWFEKLRSANSYDCIVLAHHADDQAETFFVNLIRGSSIAGLKGMKPKHGTIVRPLLFASRDQINSYINDNNISYRDDDSNKETKYLRNKIRHKLIPALKTIHPHAFDGLTKSMQLLADDQLLYESLLENKKKQHLIIKDKSSFINKTQLLKEQNSSSLLYMLIRDYGFTADQAGMIHRSLQGQPGKRFYSKNHELNINRDYIEVFPLTENTSEKAIQINPGVSEINSPIRLIFTKLNIKEVSVLKQPPKIALVDQELLLYPLTLRRWKQGDSFQPFGMKGKKLVSDFLTDQHYTIAEKANSYVLTDKNDNIIWVAGKRIDNRYRISANTSCVLKVELID